MYDRYLADICIRFVVLIGTKLIDEVGPEICLVSLDSLALLLLLLLMLLLLLLFQAFFIVASTGLFLMFFTFVTRSNQYSQ